VATDGHIIVHVKRPATQNVGAGSQMLSQPHLRTAIYRAVRLRDNTACPAIADVKQAGAAQVDDPAVDVQNAGPSFSNVKVVAGIERARVQRVIAHRARTVPQSKPAAEIADIDGGTVLHIRTRRIGTVPSAKFIQRPNRIGRIYLDDI